MTDYFSESDRGWHLREIRADEAWRDTGTRGAGIRIGHIDTGYADHVELEPGAVDVASSYDCLKNQPDARDPLVPDPGPQIGGNTVGKKFPQEWPGHGTFTGSVLVSRGWLSPAPPAFGAAASGAGNDGAPAGSAPTAGKLTGVAPEATLVPFRATRSVVLVQSNEVGSALYRAVRSNCHVISMSLGGFPTTFLHEGLKHAIGHDVIVVAAGGQVWPIPPFPGDFAECISVAATNQIHEPWGDTAKGPGITLSAPGARIWRADPNGSTTKVERGNGSSYATCCVAGTAALWLAAHGRDNLIKKFEGKNRIQYVFREILERTAVRPDPNTWDKGMGAGILDAREVVGRDLDSVNLNRDFEYEDNKIAWFFGLFPKADLPFAKSTLSFMFSPAGSALPGALSRDEEQRLASLMERYGVELLHLLMRRPEAFELLCKAVESLAGRKRDEAAERAIGVLRMLAALASRTLAGLIRPVG